VKGYAFVNLLSNGFVRGAVTGMKGTVVAIRTTSCAYCPITVWTRKTGIYHNLLKACSVCFYKISGKRTVSLHNAKVNRLLCQIKELL